VDTSKKYVVNIDFPTVKAEGGHKVHLNPYFGELDPFSKDRILRHYNPKGYKIPTDGGPIYLSREEARDCIKHDRTLRWHNRTALNFRECKRCNKLREWDI